MALAIHHSVYAQQDCLQWRIGQDANFNGATSKLVAAYDSFRGVVVAVDGNGLSQEWNGSTWSRITDAPGMLQCGGLPCTVLLTICDTGSGPSACVPTNPLWVSSGVVFMGTAAFDALRGVTVVYDNLDTIREWNGQTWVLKQPSPSPGALIRPQMTFHPSRQTVLMFGGIPAPGTTATNAMWEWDGNQWTQVTSAHHPPIRYSHGQAFDESRGVLVVFGGRSSSSSSATFYDDLWEWDGNDWLQRSPPAGDPSPGIRVEHTMAYDDVRKTVVMVGGSNELNADRTDVWDWNGQTWRQRSPQPGTATNATPLGGSLRRRYAAYDSSRQLLHLIGGSTSEFHWIIEHPTTPEVASGPVSQQVIEGNPIAFSVITEPPTSVEFQWRKDGVAIPGANTAGFGISAVTMADQGLYDVMVSRSGHDPYPPCGTVVSPPAALTVIPATPADLNGDGAVDLIDFADFATVFSGPEE